MNFSANLTFMFQEKPFQDRFAAAAESGFAAVEFLFPYGFAADEIKGWLSEAGLRQVLFNAPPGDWNAGERGMAALPGREEEFRQSIQLALGYADRLDCSRIHVMAGVVPQGCGDHECYAVLARNLKWASELAARQGVTLLLEPLNPVDMPRYLYSRTADVAAFIERLGLDNVRLQFDIYHRQMLEGNLINAIHEYFHVIGHIQVADVPGRHEPGSGEINYPALFNCLAEKGYDGWIGCEYLPKEDTAAGLAWLSGRLEEKR